MYSLSFSIAGSGIIFRPGNRGKVSPDLAVKTEVKVVLPEAPSATKEPLGLSG